MRHTPVHFKITCIEKENLFFKTVRRTNKLWSLFTVGICFQMVSSTGQSESKNDEQDKFNLVYYMYLNLSTCTLEIKNKQECHCHKIHTSQKLLV